jgi:RNA polymerase sigma factor (sigma-70 family)
MRKDSSKTKKELSVYYQNVGKYKLPTKEEERALFARYAAAREQAKTGATEEIRKRAKTEQIELKHKIAQGYLRFVIRQALQRTRDPVLLADLIGYGNTGLMVAIDRFDLAKESRFLTYGAYWIRVFIQEAIYKNPVVHLPGHTRKELKRKRLAALRNGTELPLNENEEPAVCSIDDIAYLSDRQPTADVTTAKKEVSVLKLLQQANLTPAERLILFYSYHPDNRNMSSRNLRILLFDQLGLGLTGAELDAMRRSALHSLRDALAKQGITSLDEVLP